jgi:hypothetical protein
MTQEAIVIDTIHENPMKWAGTIKDWSRTDRGKIPIIKKKTSSLKDVFWPGNWKAEKYPYRLDQDNIKRVTGVRGSDVVFLIPDTSIPNYTEKDYMNSFYYQHIDQDESERIKKLQDDLQDKEQEIQRLRKKLDEAKEDDSGSTSSSSSTSSKLKCSYCDSTSKRKDWVSSEKKQQDFCPKCGQGNKDNAMEV